jgi:hypothetical protein
LERSIWLRSLKSKAGKKGEVGWHGEVLRGNEKGINSKGRFLESGESKVRINRFAVGSRESRWKETACWVKRRYWLKGTKKRKIPNYGQKTTTPNSATSLF